MRLGVKNVFSIEIGESNLGIRQLFYECWLWINGDGIVRRLGRGEVAF